MRIILIASGEFAIPTLRLLVESEHDIPLVVSQPPRPSGRGRRTTPTPVSMLAADLGLTTLETEDINTGEPIDRLRSTSADLGLVIAFGQKLGPELLSLFPGGCLNLHASLLPRYRGAGPINWAIIRGEERTGVTVFRIVKRMDAGPILTQRWTAIKPEETAGELHDRLAAIGVDAVQAALTLFEGGNIPEGEPQDAAAATLAPKLKKSDGHIHFDRPAIEVVNHIHGVTPWPGAQAIFQAEDGRWEKLLLTRVRPDELPEPPRLEPGTLDDRLMVAATDRFIEILELKPSSGRTMTWPDYVNGRHVRPGDRLLSPGEHRQLQKS